MLGDAEDALEWARAVESNAGTLEGSRDNCVRWPRGDGRGSERSRVVAQCLRCLYGTRVSGAVLLGRRPLYVSLLGRPRCDCVERCRRAWFFAVHSGRHPPPGGRQVSRGLGGACRLFLFSSADLVNPKCRTAVSVEDTAIGGTFRHHGSDELLTRKPGDAWGEQAASCPMALGLGPRHRVPDYQRVTTIARLGDCALTGLYGVLGRLVSGAPAPRLQVRSATSREEMKTYRQSNVKELRARMLVLP